MHIHQFSRPVNGRTLYGGHAPSVAAQPSARFAASTHSVVAVAIANLGWASQIETSLAAGAPLLNES